MGLRSSGKSEISRAPNWTGTSHCGSIRKIFEIGSVIFLILLTSGCATPKVQPSDPHLLFKTGLLSFLEDELTTREEAVLKLGLPTMQMEGERILMYQVRADDDGKWYMTAPQWDAQTGLRTWREGTSSLVLVFGEDGVLRKHSLVTTK